MGLDGDRGAGNFLLENAHGRTTLSTMRKCCTRRPEFTAMKSPLLALLLFSLAANDGLAQAHIIKQRAKDLNQQNNVRQGVTPGAPSAPVNPATPPPAAPTPATPQPAVASPEALRRYDVTRTKSDLTAIKPGATLTAAQTDKIARNLASTARGPVKPSAKSTSQLARDLGAALSGSNLPPTSRSKLAEDLVTIMNCGGNPTSKTQSTIDIVLATLEGGGVDRKLAGAVAADLKSIAGELQKGTAR